MQIENKIQQILGQQNPMSQRIYSELNEKIERFTTLMHLFMVKFSIAGIVLPAVFVTFLNYYVYHLDDESFYLPTRVMYVRKHSSIVFCLFARHKQIKKRRMKKKTVTEISTICFSGYHSIGKRPPHM